MAWGKLLLTTVNLIGALVKFLQERRLISDTEQRMISESLQRQVKVLEAANEARNEQRQRNASVPDSGVLPDDGFRRD